MYTSTHILYRIADAFLRRRVLFMSCVAVVTLATLLLLLTRSRSYMAMAAVQVAPEEVAHVLGVSQRSNYTPLAQQHVNRFTDLLNDNRKGGFLDTALTKAKLDTPINLDPRARDPRYRAFRERLSAAMESDEVFTITLVWDNPGECERMVRAMQTQYIEQAGQLRQAKALATNTFLDAQIASYEQRLRDAEQSLIDYKQKNLGHLPEAETAELRQLAELRRQLDEMRIASRDSELRRQVLLRRIAQVKPQSILEQTIGDDTATAKLKELQVERSLLLVEYLPESDEVKAIDAKIAALQKTIASKAKELSADGGSVLETKLQDNPEYQALMQDLTEANIAKETQEARMQLLQGQIDEYIARIRKIPAAQRFFNDRMRDYDIVKSQYESLLKRREEAELKGNLDKVAATSTFSPIGLIYAQRTLSKTKMLLLAMAGCLLGFILATGVLLVAEWLDPSLRYGEDAERLVGVPLLASLPDLPDGMLPSGSSEPAPLALGQSAGTETSYPAVSGH